ncbi:6-aminohexanoate-dimer hydrolase [Microbulbifer aggregans]|uniref:6-aminohexanoate-dimer hydrolase n=1 Tax=Microbulbifer aggregans TaxID=1769779 RepID=A0A1C9W5R1_9GAMM|nr:serine hydrolase [Microbulbifer aggregans]AOS96494.1 6-aminohexanoate-dimer hydrolase [Microbulbifer aggregans]
MKTTIKILLGTVAALALAVTLMAPSLLGFSVTQLGSAVRVATGMGAKLACSGRYVSGFAPNLIVEDLASYSPANRLLDLQYDDDARRVTADLVGLGEVSARYREGLGCALEIGDTAPLDGVTMETIKTSDAPWPKGTGTPAIDPDLQQQLGAMLARDNAAGLETRALLVVQDGALEAEAYAEGIHPQTPLLGWSMGKSLTAMMQGRLEALGQGDRTSTTLFPEWREDARRDITLEQLLQMSSGLAFDETYAPGSDATHMLFSAHSASDVALVSPAAHTPGSHFSYSSGTTNLIARWLHEQLGGDVQASVDFFQRELLQPLGMAHTVFEVDPSGVFVGSSYIYASARDWARLGQLMLNRGELNGQRLLTEEWVQRAATPNASDNEPRYGYQFWLNSGSDALRYPELPADTYFMQGNRKQVVMISPSTNTVIVRLGWSSGSYPVGENFAELLPAAGNEKLSGR